MMEGQFREQVPPLYLTPRRGDVEAVLQGVPWYNSGLAQPQLGQFKPGDLEIVEVEVTIKKV